MSNKFKKILKEVDEEQISKMPPDVAEIWKRWKKEEKKLRIQFKKEILQEELDEKKERDDQRDADFLNAIDKISRAGYVGEHGTFTVPDDLLSKIDGWKHQAQHGDYDETKSNIESNKTTISCWKSYAGSTKIDAQREYISLANEIITQYGWNPPVGWR